MKNPRMTAMAACIGWWCLTVGVGMATEADRVPAAPETPSPRQVFVITLEGEVDPGMAAFAKRACREVNQAPESLAVFAIDTFGGRVDSALEIVDALLTVPENRSIAYVEKKAISAGALISLACGDLVMRPAATLGDCAPIAYTQEGMEMLGEKFQSPLRAKFRALAKRNGYPESLAEAMVSSEKPVYRLEMGGRRLYMDGAEYNDLTEAEKKKITAKKTVVEKGELLTMEADEAVDLGFARFTAGDVPEMLLKMEVKHGGLIHVEETWSESLMRWIGAVAPILLMLGLAGLYLEMKTPGFGLPGLIGITCLAVLFLSQYMAGLADYTELLIILAGLVLMGIEVFVLPGFGIAGFAGIVFIAAGMVLALQDFVLPDPAVPWESELLVNHIAMVGLAYIGAFLTALACLRYVLPRFGAGREGPLLMTDLAHAHADSRETANVRPGDTGVALSALRPSGRAVIHNDWYDVVTEGEFMEKNTPIVVSAVKGNRVVVARRGEDAGRLP